jgi:transcriptional regulator with XRE-family HTH domain
MARLKQVRRQAGFSLQDIVNESGLSRPVVEKAEKGREAIRYESAIRIVNALNNLANSSHTVESLDILTLD